MGWSQLLDADRSPIHLLEDCGDAVNYGAAVFPHVVIGVAQHSKPVALEPAVTVSVVVVALFQAMRETVELDDQPLGEADEVDDEWSNRLSAAELVPKS